MIRSSIYGYIYIDISYNYTFTYYMYIICICIYLNIYLNEFPRLESDLPEQAGALVAALVVEALQLLESGFLGLVALDKLCLKTPIAL